MLKKIKLKLKITSFHLRTLNLGLLNILFFFKKKITGNYFNFTPLIRLPRQRNRLTVLKAPTINKSARTQYELRNYTWILNICYSAIAYIEFKVALIFLHKNFFKPLQIGYISIKKQKLF